MTNSQQKQLCKLCEEKESGYQESHIIPKFFTKSLYFKNGKNQGLKTAKIVNKVLGQIEEDWQQDALKERYLFCSDCEKYFELLDTHFCNTIYTPLRNNEKYKAFFIRIVLKHTIFSCEKANENIVSLFLLSIFLRCHASDLPLFKNFKLTTQEYIEIRNLLNNYSTLKARELKEKIIQTPIISFFHYLIFTYANNSRIVASNNFIDINYRSNSGYYYIVINDYVITIFLKKPMLSFTEALNNNNDKTRVIILSDTQFNDVRRTGFEKHIRENF